MSEKIVQTAGRDALGEFAPEFPAATTGISATQKAAAVRC